MIHNEIANELQEAIKYIEQSINNINLYSNQIKDDLIKWKSDTTIYEIKESLNQILLKVNKWYVKYQNSKNILDIELQEYDWVAKETSYILGECSLIDELNAEVINHLIICIGKELCDELKKRCDK